MIRGILPTFYLSHSLCPYPTLSESLSLSLCFCVLAEKLALIKMRARSFAIRSKKFLPHFVSSFRSVSLCLCFVFVCCYWRFGLHRETNNNNNKKK